MILSDEEIKNLVIQIAKEFWPDDYEGVVFTADDSKFYGALVKAVLSKVSQQEPIYMWRLEDDGWMECTKEWFDSEISSGYEKRIVYAHPSPPQSSLKPESKL